MYFLKCYRGAQPPPLRPGPAPCELPPPERQIYGIRSGHDISFTI